MKKNKTAIVAAAICMLVLAVFAACGNGNKNEPPTVIGAVGSVYDEITEVVSQVVTEIVSELKTEIVTDKVGKTEIKSEVVTEIKSEVVSSVVTVTVPHTTVAETKKGETTVPTTTAEQTTAAATDPIEDVPYPAGEKVSVELGADGLPKEFLREKAFGKMTENKQIYLSCVMVTKEIGLIETGTPIELWIKGDKMAFLVTANGIKMKMIAKDNSLYMVLPLAGTYFEITEDELGGSVFSDVDLWGNIASLGKTYVGTTKVKVKGTTYFCEEYTDEIKVSDTETKQMTSKFYFSTSTGDLKRLEMIDADGSTQILKISAVSTNVADSNFDINPKYKKLDAETFLSALGQNG